MSCWMTDSCIVISSIVAGAAKRSGAGGAGMASRSSIVHVRESTAAWRAAVSSLEAR
jgi:hypothetical protein